MSNVSYAGLAPLVYNDALADDAPRIRKLLQAREIRDNPSLLRQLAALLKALSWTMPGARKAWGQMLKESEAWKAVHDHLIQHSKVSLTEAPRMGEGPGMVAAHVAKLLDEDGCEIAWITGGGVSSYTLEPNALNVLRERLGSRREVHMIRGGASDCEGLLQLLEIAKGWERGVARQEIIIGPLYPPAWWPLINAPYACDPGALAPMGARTMVIHLGPSPLDVLVDSRALVRNASDQRLVHRYLVTPHERPLDTSESRELEAASSNSKQLKDISMRAAERAWERFLADGSGQRYMGPPEDIQFGQRIAAASLLAGEVDDALALLKLSDSSGLRQRIVKSRELLEWAMAHAVSQSMAVSHDSSAAIRGSVDTGSRSIRKARVGEIVAVPRPATIIGRILGRAMRTVDQPVSVACEENDGYWYCATHNVPFRSPEDASKVLHAGGDDCVEVWMCKFHGPETQY